MTTDKRFPKIGEDLVLLIVEIPESLCRPLVWW